MNDIEELFDPQVPELRKVIDRLQRQLVKEKDRTEAISEAVYRAIADGISALDFPRVTAPAKTRGTKHDETAVALLSDWQLGKKTPSYSSDVCAERVGIYADKLLSLTEIQRLDHPVNRLAVFLLGDMIEGELIFPGQAYQIDSSLFRQVTVDGPRILTGFVRRMAAQFEAVDIFAVPGNHGHLGGRSRKEMHPESNGDRMLYEICRQLTAEASNVTWNVSLDWYQVADLGERNRWLLLHGDQVRGWAGVPWYGWMKKVLGWASLSRLWEEMSFDWIAAGHFHTPVSLYINGRRLWINASTESHNPYALEQLSAAGEPAQWLLFTKPGRGVTCEYLVSLEP